MADRGGRPPFRDRPNVLYPVAVRRIVSDMDVTIHSTRLDFGTNEIYSNNPDILRFY
jgi:hypothetical protein